MDVAIEFLPWLSEHLGGKEFRSRHLLWQIEVSEGETVGELCARLAEGNESFRHMVFDPASQGFDEQVIVVLNDRLLDLAGGLKAALRDGDRLAVIPAMAGGTHSVRRA